MPRVRNNQKTKANPGRPQAHLGFVATLRATAEQAVPAPNADAAEYPVLHGPENAPGESRTLAALRDALLPKLLSGELRVPAA